MRYRWDAEQMHDLTVIPSVVADRHLKLASEIHLKVLLWLARFGKGDFDAAVCAEAIGISKEDCEDAFCYWSDAGVLSIGGRRKATSPSGTAALDKTEVKSVKPAARPRAVKPQMTEVVARKKENKAFSDLVDTASARLGRPLSQGDMETLLYLFDTAGLPAEVIMMVIMYARSMDKSNMRYIEKVALDWADRGIDTMAKAEEYLCALERRQNAFMHIQQLLSLSDTPKKADLDYAEQWIVQWKLSDDLIEQAYRLCMDHIQKFNSKYMHTILQGWYTDGVKTPNDVTDKKKKGKRGVVKNSSLDVTAYENIVKDYIPVYHDVKG